MSLFSHLFISNSSLSQLIAQLCCGEILEQLYHANQLIYFYYLFILNYSYLYYRIEKIRNVVFMGMGEPLDNYEVCPFPPSSPPSPLPPFSLPLPHLPPTGSSCCYPRNDRCSSIPFEVFFFFFFFFYLFIYDYIIIIIIIIIIIPHPLLLFFSFSLEPRIFLFPLWGLFLE